MAYKMKSSGLPFKELGSSPAKQVDQKITQGVSKNINTPGWKTTTVSTTGLPNQGTSSITTLDKTGQVVSESSGGSSGSSKPKPKTTNYRTYKPKNYPNNPDLTKRSYDIKIPKKSTVSKVAKVAKNVLGKAGRFLGGKALGVAGMMMATSSKADQPKKGKGKIEYPGGKMDFSKKK